MLTRPRRRHRIIDKIPGQIYLWLAMLISAASSAVTRKLTEIGAQHLIDGRNPISLCNVLFVGNLYALIVFIIIYWRQWNKTTLKQLSRKDWLILTIVGILSGAIAPGLIFQALALTNVNNVVLVGRLQPPLTLALSVWLLKERVNFWEVAGSIVAFIGVAVIIILQAKSQGMMNVGGFHIGLGEVLAALGALLGGVCTIIIKKYLSKIPLGIYNIFRTALGTVIFFFLALNLYGSQHFMDVFSPFLWQWMFIYALVIVVLAQSFSTQGLRACSVSVVSLVSSFSPIASTLAAYLILKEAPTMAQYVGGSLILVGIFLSQVGIQSKISPRMAASKVTSIEAAQKAEADMGFKGI